MGEGTYQSADDNDIITTEVVSDNTPELPYVAPDAPTPPDPPYVPPPADEDPDYEPPAWLVCRGGVPKKRVVVAMPSRAFTNNPALVGTSTQTKEFSISRESYPREFEYCEGQ